MRITPSRNFALGDKGFHITFDNGWTISVQWGSNNYCSNRGGVFQNAVTAEIAIFDPAWNFYRPNGWNDDVLGYQTANQVAEWISYVARCLP